MVHSEAGGDAVVNRDSRPEFIVGKPRDGISLEMAIDIDGKTVAAHYPLEFGIDPSKSVALAVVSLN